MEAAALLLLQRDAMLIAGDKPNMSPGRVEFTREELERGRQLAPQAFISRSGSLVIKLDS